jgi:hypothetical protein
MIANYYEGIRYLEGGRDKNSRPIENNTRVERRGEDIAIRLHATDVAVIHPDNSITLHDGGWLTVTTKDRMNYALGMRPVKIGSDRGVWYVYSRSWEKRGRYFDGITISETGTILNPRSESLEERLAFAEEKMVRAINRYIDGYFEAMEAGKMPLPSGGDCWDCSLIVVDGPDKGKPMGDVKDGDHLLSHLKERYYVPSLLWNATRARGYGDANFVMATRLDRESYDFGLMKVQRAWQSDQPDRFSVKELRRDLRKYLGKRLLKTRAH